MNGGLKQAGILLILATFMLQLFYTHFIVIDYYLNTAAYKKDCVNKEKLVLHCNGKCQMMKKLRQEESKNEQNPERRNDNKNELLYFSTMEYPVQFFDNLLVKTYPPFNNSTVKKIAFDFFQPPRV